MLIPSAVTIFPASGGGTTFTSNVASMNDDGLENPIGTFTNGTQLGIGNISNNIHSGMRFLNVTIPQGTTINSATITVYNESTGAGSPAGSWYAWANDNAGQFSTGGNLPSNVTKTTANTAVNIASGTVVHSITSVIQEIINRAGWVSGNAINLIAFNTGSPISAQAWDRFGVNPALLTINY